jgi:hypothetical protein
VRLVSSDGASITLHPAAYQFERAPAPGSERDWDANWLMIQGDVRAGDGRQWTFLDPCLTTWDARRLSAWMHDVAVGDDTAGHPDIAFLEPNLSFSVDDRPAGRLRLQVCLSHEALPPWVSRDHEGWHAGEYALVLDISREDLAHAAQAWDLEHEQFPER